MIFNSNFYLCLDINYRKHDMVFYFKSYIPEYYHVWILLALA